jgi:hypothetical protein
LFSKLIRRQVTELAVRAALIVVEPPGLDNVLNLGHRGELVYVQTLIAQSAVKGFNQGILHGFAWSNEVELHASAKRPIFERP